MNQLKQEIQNEQAKQNIEGNPSGTHFAVITLAVLLLLVGAYFLIAHLYDLMQSANDIAASK